MAVIVRLFDFTPGTLIQSSQVDAEFSQLVDLLNSTSTTKNVYIKFSDATVPVLTLDQLSTGLVQRWLVGGVEVASVSNTGAFSVGPSLTINATAPFLDLVDTDGEDFRFLVNADEMTVRNLTGPITFMTFRGGANDDIQVNRPEIMEGLAADAAIPLTIRRVDQTGRNFRFSPSVLKNGTNDPHLDLSSGQTYSAGLFLEQTGAILNLGINGIAQLNARDTTKVGGNFRFDTRTSIGINTQAFYLLGIPTGGSVENTDLVVNLQDGNTFLNPTRGLTGVNKTSSIGAQVHIHSGATGRIGQIVNNPSGTTVDVAQFNINDVAQIVVTKDGGMKVNNTGVAVNANNRLVVNHSEAPQTDVAVSFRAGATNVRPLDLVGEASGTVGLFRAYEDNDATERFRISNDGKVETRAGNGATPATSFLTLGGLYHRNTTSVGNVGAGTDDLITKTVEANVLGEDGDTFVVLMAGTASAQDGGAGDTRTISWSYGGQTFDTRVINATNAACRWTVEITIVRTSSTVAFFVSKFEAWNTGIDTAPLRSFQVTGTIAVTHSNSNILKATGASSDAVNNDIVQEVLLVWKYSTP